MGQQAADFFLILIFTTVAVVSSIEYKHIKLEEFMSCPNNEQLVAEILEHEIERVSKNMISLNITLDIKTEFIEDYTVLLELSQCESTSEIHTCRHFITKQADNFCTHLHDPEQAWTDYVEKTEPKLECPIKKDTYVTYNALIDAAIVEDAPEGYWLAEIKGLDGSEVLGCVRVTARIWPENFVGEEERESYIEEKAISSYV